MNIELTPAEEKHILTLREQAAHDRGYNRALNDVWPRFDKQQDRDEVKTLFRTIHPSQKDPTHGD